VGVEWRRFECLHAVDEVVHHSRVPLLSCDMETGCFLSISLADIHTVLVKEFDTYKVLDTEEGEGATDSILP